MPNNKQMG